MRQQVLSKWVPAILITLASLIWAAVLALDLLPILRGAYDWEWSYRPMLVKQRIAPLLVGVLCYVPVALWLNRLRRTGPLLIWSFLAGICLTLAAVHLRGDVLYRLYSLTVSGRASGWHMAAARMPDVMNALRDWPSFMLETGSFSPHTDHAPPGMILIYWAAARLLDRLPLLAEWMAGPLRWLLCQFLAGYTDGEYAAAWIGILTPLWASLTVFPLFYLGRRVFGDEVARWSVAWWPLIPSVLLFAPLPYTSFALPTLVMVALLWHGLWNDKPGYSLGAGVLLSLMTFLNFVFIPLALFAGLLALGTYWMRTRMSPSERRPWLWPIRMGLWFGLGLSSAWILFYAFTGTSLAEIWEIVAETQRPVYISRPYLPFLALNLNDFFMFTGWPLVLLAAIGTWGAVKNIAAGPEARPGDVMITAAGMTILLIDLGGTPRGETGRLLLFLIPWLLFAAGAALGPYRAAGAVLTILQAITTVVVVVCLHVLGSEFRARAEPIVPPSRIPAVRPPSHAVGAVLDDAVTLLTIEGRVDSRVDQAGQERTSLDLWLTWETIMPSEVRYRYSLSLADSRDGPPGTTVLVEPFSDAYPMSCWKPEDGPLTDRVRLALPSGELREWWVDLRVLDPSTGEAGSWRTADGLQTEDLRLGPFLP